MHLGAPEPTKMSLQEVRALSVIAGLTKAAGGPTINAIALTEAAVKAGIDNNFATVQAPAGEPEEFPSSKLVQTYRVRGFHFPALRFMWSPAFKSGLRQICLVRKRNIIHSHGIWTQPNHAAAAVARELGLKLIVSTHGMLEPWAWRHHAWKKRPVWWLWQRRDLCSAAVLRATAQQEVEALRALGLRNPIALIPNGVNLPIAYRTLCSAHRKKEIRRALFLSRIHPKKGLLNLVAAWDQVRPAGWEMVICGPDDGGHLEQVKRVVERAGLSDVFEFRPPAYETEKAGLFASADLFVLPTFSENFGVAIAEALAAGVPVITTRGTPWEELVSHRCGWWIDIGVEPLVAALHEAIALTDEQRLVMGQRGRRLVEENYAWPKIGQDMKAVYEWVLGSGQKPSCVTES